ncbi:SidA/IucD/PvdA family monooxygenase [Glutamicibacter endophyticus]
MSTPTTHEHYDVIAIGAGPFNLGFAALSDGLPDFSLAVLEARDSFSWHPGMMLPGTHLQVPFMADLVTMADPTNRFSFLNYMKLHGRIYPFYIRENFYALRNEYSDYLAWAAEQLPSVKFGHRVMDISYQNGRYALSVLTDQGLLSFSATKLVLGTGSEPYLPDSVTSAARGSGAVTHSSEYLFRRGQILAEVPDSQRGKVVTVLGSGQSAAEIFLDLLRSLPEEDHLVWSTRSERYFPLEYTKLTLEMTSPEYIDHFHALPMDRRDALSKAQKGLYKGINADLIDEIHEELYQRSVHGAPNVHLRTGSSLREVRPAGDTLQVTLNHDRTDEEMIFGTDQLVLATGYRQATGEFLKGISERISYLPDGRFDVDRNYSIGRAQDIFVQNAELHTHGFTAPDLGMGAYRNSVLINRLASREVYPVEERIAFQKFGAAELEGLPSSILPATATALD